MKFFRRTEIEKADLIGERLIPAVDEATGLIIECLRTWEIRFRDDGLHPRFTIEVLAFHMHIVDRVAFGHFGKREREVFADRLVMAVAKGALTEPSTTTPAKEFVSNLLETYNHRQAQYGTYKTLMAKPNEPLEDTLYWEFSKVLLEYTDNVNVVNVMSLNLLVADLVSAFLKTTELKEVLSDAGGGWPIDEWRKGQENSKIKGWADALLRAFLVSIAVVVAWFSPIPIWGKVLVFFAAMFIIGLAVQMVKGAK